MNAIKTRMKKSKDNAVYVDRSRERLTKYAVNVASWQKRRTIDTMIRLVIKYIAKYAAHLASI